MKRVVTLLIVLACSGWAIYWLFDRYAMFSAVPQIKLILFVGGLIITATALVLMLAGFILGPLLRVVFQFEPTGLVSATVYAILTFLATTLVLGLLGSDIGTILTTSAILGAVVGFSMQTTISGLISGIALSSEPLLANGAGIKFDGEIMTVEKKLWRHFIARRSDNVRVVIPNQSLAKSSLPIYPEDEPARFDVFLHLPADVPPQKLTDLLADAFADMEHLDGTQPVMVAPLELKPGNGTVEYRIRLFARYYMQIDELQGEVLRRAWYVLNRAGFYQSDWMRAELGDMMAQASPGMPLQMQRNLAEDGQSFRFAPGELLRFSGEAAGRSILIVEGDATTRPDLYLNLVEHGRRARAYLPPLVVERLSPTARLRKIADRLALEIGPVAEHATRAAIRAASDSDDLIAQLADHITDPVRKDAFRADLGDLASVIGRRGPGTIVPLARDAVGRVLPEPELRAVSEVLVVSFQTRLAVLKAAE